MLLLKTTLSILLGLFALVVHADTYYVERPTPYINESFAYAGDSGLFTHRVSRDTLHAWTANSKSYMLQGAGPEDLWLTNTQVIQGADGTEYECGAWLKSVVERDDGSYLGLFHGESDCVYGGGQPISTFNTFFAESYDMGKWFGPMSNEGVFDVVVEDRLNGIGNATMVEHDGTLHIYALDTLSAWNILHATAPLSDPLDVTIEGSIGPLEVGSNVTYVGTGTRLSSVGFRHCPFLQGDVSPDALEQCSDRGLMLSYIDDFDQVTTVSAPLVYLPYVNRSDRSRTDLTSSVSIVPPHGGSRWQSSGFLTYSIAVTGDDYEDRQMVKRKFLRVEDGGADIGLIRLSTYSDGETYRTTTDVPQRPFEFLYDEPIYLYTSKTQPDMVPLYEVYAPSLNSYLLRRWDATFASRVVRVLGWVKLNPEEGTVPIYRTYDSESSKHGVGLGPNGILLGYGKAG